MTAPLKSNSQIAGESGEDALLQRIRRVLAAGTHSSAGLRVGVGDDAAVSRPRAGYEAILTCDWFLQGTHFLLDRHPPHAIGWKCLARAVSDLAAMGAEPRCFLLSMALPPARVGAWLDEFLRGLREASRTLKCPAAGGDTTRRDDVLINVTAVGECRRGRAVLRSGARPGDTIFVTGRLGEAEYGLRLMREGKGRAGAREVRLRKHLYPQPRLAVGAWLGRRVATSMMDLSDGLSSDLPRLCEASGVGARIEASKLPCVRLAARDAHRFEALQLALHGGDDYELLFTVARKNVAKIPAHIAGIALTQIGTITTQRKVLMESPDGSSRDLSNQGWDPFRAPELPDNFR